MKKTKSLLSILLCMLMVFTSASFVACDDGDTDTTAATVVNPNEKDEDGETYYIPDEKYNEEITILCPTDDNEWSCNDFFEESSSDEAVPNAVYMRKKKVEETFGVTINVVEGARRENINEKIRTSETAGDIEYHIVMQTIPRVYVLAQNDLILNLEQVENLNVKDSPSWDQSYLAQTSINGQNYFATGDITTMEDDATWVMMFNKKMAQNLDLENIYSLVEDGKWTMDKLIELSQGVYQDKTGNGPSSDDTYPIATTVDFIQGLFYGANAKIIEKNEADIPELKFYNQTNTDIIDKIIEIYYKSNKITYDCHDYISEEPQVHLLAQRMFEENRALFYSEVMQCAIRLREMETAYGIIPVPKFDENQTNYTTHSVADVTLMAAFPCALEKDPKTLAMAGAIAQALAVEGRKILRPAYYEKSLMQKGTRDQESQAMLEIIFKNRVCDLGYAAEGNINTIYSNMRTYIKKGENRISSINQMHSKRVETAIKELVDSFEG